MKRFTPSTIALASFALCIWCTAAHAQDNPSEPPAAASPTPDVATEPNETPAPKPEESLPVSPAYQSIEDSRAEQKKLKEGETLAIRAGQKVFQRSAKMNNKRAAQQAKQLETVLGQTNFAPTKDSPTLDVKHPIGCLTVPTQSARRKFLRMQCDEKTKSCLVAEDTLYKVGVQGNKAVPTKRRALRLERYCSYRSRRSQETHQNLYKAMAQGYSIVPAKLDTKYGYGRDEFNRTFQTHFDLRSRFGVGVYYVGNIKPGAYTNTMGLEVFGTYEDWDQYDRTRRRTRFLEGSLSLAPFFARATVFETEKSAQSEDPLLFIATMVGPPKRYDINLDLHTALTLGRLDYRTINGKQYSQLDIIEGRLQWELLRSLDMEDYVLVHAGVGTGTRRWTDGDAEPLYLYPQVGARGAWTLSPRGLLELKAEANIRWGAEFEGDNAKWTSATSSVGLEWLVLSLSNQPLTLFARHEWEYLDMRGSKRDIKTHSMRWSAGARVSLFVPPPKRARPTKVQP